MKKIYRLLLALVLGLSFTEYSCASEAEEKKLGSKEAAAAKFASLHEAADAGDVEAVNRMLAAGADVDEREDSGDTALMVAAGADHVAVVEALLKAGADVNKANRYGFTALMRASNVAVVEALIKAGAEVDRVNLEGDTALFLAVRRGPTLIFVGANPYRERNDFQAVWPVDLVKTLIFAGADPYRENNAHQTAWKIADTILKFDSTMKRIIQVKIADTTMKRVIEEAVAERNLSRDLTSNLASEPAVLGPVMARAAREREVVARRQREEAAGSAAAQEEPKESAQAAQEKRKEGVEDATAPVSRCVGSWCSWLSGKVYKKE